MSSSEPPDSQRPSGTLIVTSKPGVEVRILDGRYNVVAAGVGTVKQRLPEGVYVVKWSAGGRVEQQVHRLRPSWRALRVNGGNFPLESAAPGLTGQSDSRSDAQGMAAAKLAAAPRTRSQAEIVVFVRAQAETIRSDLTKSIRLFDAADRAMRSDSALVEAAQDGSEPELGWAARVYGVTAGEYRLRYAALTGDALLQSVYAIRGRRTVVFLRYGSADWLVPQYDGDERVRYSGVDPSATTIVSTALRDRLCRRAEETRIAEILLHALASSTTPIDRKLYSRLQAGSADPFLQVYGAAVILARLEKGDWPSPDGTLDGRSLKSGLDAERLRLDWRKRAARLLRTAARAGPFTDLVACQWKLAALGEPSIAPLDQVDGPPMLDCCWRWIVEHCAAHPGAMADTPSTNGASRGRIAASPWLVWRGAAAKAGSDPHELRPEERPDVDHLAAKLSEVGFVSEGELSREAACVAAAVKALPENVSGDAARSTLTQSLWTSGEALDQMISRTSYEVAQLTQVGHARPDTNAKFPDPPGLALPIRTRDDPNKGRFGGAERADGLILLATFEPRAEAGWTEIRLRVEAEGVPPPPDGETAIFVLHDSFVPACREAAFVGGRAELVVTAFGGFTVGAWLPERMVQLELDLALQPHAPTVIREL